ILLDLKEMYGAGSRTRRLNLSRKLFKAQMPEGASIHDLGLEMINMIEKLTQLGFFMDHDLQIDLILTSLPGSLSQIVEYFHLIEIEVTLSELVSMLRTAEANLDSTKSKIPAQEGKLGASGSDAKNRMKQLAAEGACFQYGKTRHWKKDCRVTGMFMIELNLALNSSSSWVLDARCGTNLCNSLQGLRKVRKLGAGDLDLRLGDGSRIIAEVVGKCDVNLSNGYVLTLDPCYFI
ncbi:UBN2_2 domain-containing protein, partial [Cephalotus follicularis]